MHLKRFRFTPFFNLVKRNEPVELLRDVVVSSKQVRKNKEVHQAAVKVNM